ncbi:hypothetical protein GYH30_029471 [Glycine max]|nr:hypothetical protein GYH30_029471 [Glycine max]
MLRVVLWALTWRGGTEKLQVILCPLCTLEDWLTLNLSESSILNHKWHRRFGILLDLIWQRRNMLIFHNILWNEHDLLLQA